jgi:hypothetical protein
MSLTDAIAKMKFDNRLVQQNLNSKTLKPDEIQKHLASLPDCSDKCETMSLFQEEPASDVNEAH